MITLNEPQILYKIRTTLGFGSVKKYSDKKQATCYHRFTVSDLAGTERLIQIFNGNLVLDKTNCRFASWLLGYNERPSVSLQIPLAPRQDLQGIALNNAWLSGFIDADGCFSAAYDRHDTVLLRFILDQKHELAALQTILSLFSMGSVSPRKEREGMYRYTLKATKARQPNKGQVRPRNSATMEAFSVLFEYLDRFSLKTMKNIDYTRFKKI
jgi:hypothetical protein